MMAAFHETQYGKRFFDSQLPKLIKECERIANALEEQNALLKAEYERLERKKNEQEAKKNDPVR
ncbi:MAG: hypothetical protein UHD64_00640 [Bacteroidales bacterium]|nr:hypothetical protein [Bacteroidales bacterium]